ncbi:hypothetical protein ASF48_08150 [Rathayibacter sp. Leaf299]|nr:hypothetical protein ASF48_08150 [Rathayibacter sp. Leaf299]
MRDMSDDRARAVLFAVAVQLARFGVITGALAAAAAIGVPVRYLGRTASVACATSRIAQRSSPRSWSASALVWHRPTPRSPASPDRAGPPSPPAGNALVGRSTSDRDAAIDLFELRLEATRRSVVHDALARWAWSGLDADVAFHLQPKLLGDREHVVLFHYTITGLILDQLTVAVDPATAPSTTIDRLVDGLLPES